MFTVQSIRVQPASDGSLDCWNEILVINVLEPQPEKIIVSTNSGVANISQLFRYGDQTRENLNDRERQHAYT